MLNGQCGRRSDRLIVKWQLVNCWMSRFIGISKSKILHMRLILSVLRVYKGGQRSGWRLNTTPSESSPPENSPVCSQSLPLPSLLFLLSSVLPTRLSARQNIRSPRVFVQTFAPLLLPLARMSLIGAVVVSSLFYTSGGKSLTSKYSSHRGHKSLLNLHNRGRLWFWIESTRTVVFPDILHCTTPCINVLFEV